MLFINSENHIRLCTDISGVKGGYMFRALTPEDPGSRYVAEKTANIVLFSETSS